MTEADLRAFVRALYWDTWERRAVLWGAVALLLLAGFGLGALARYLCLWHVAAWFVGPDAVDRILFCHAGWEGY